MGFVRVVFAICDLQKISKSRKSMFFALGAPCGRPYSEDWQNQKFWFLRVIHAPSGASKLIGNCHFINRNPNTIHQTSIYGVCLSGFGDMRPTENFKILENPKNPCLSLQCSHTCSSGTVALVSRWVLPPGYTGRGAGYTRPGSQKTNYNRLPCV